MQNDQGMVVEQGQIAVVAVVVAVVVVVVAKAKVPLSLRCTLLWPVECRSSLATPASAAHTPKWSTVNGQTQKQTSNIAVEKAGKHKTAASQDSTAQPHRPTTRNRQGAT